MERLNGPTIENKLSSNEPLTSSLTQNHTSTSNQELANSSDISIEPSSSTLLNGENSLK